GLAICRQLVTLMGGEIGARSQLGIGSDFFFTANFGLGNPASVPVLHAVPELSALRILVIDDSPNAREIFQGLLATFGYHATLTDSAAAGIAALETADPPYDLVLLDWKMPGMDGFEAAGLIRRHPKLAVQPKLVMVTAYGSDDAQRRVLAEGLDGYLTKPVNASSLLDEIMRVCGKSAVSTNLGRNNAPEHDHLANIRGLRVLLVEDNDFNQQVAKEILTGVAGVEVSIAWNGQEALDILQAQSFDAVLMDLQMPVMDGYETTEQLRRNPRFAALPIIAMTAHAMARDRERCLATGMNDFISKPFDPAELFAVLARATASRVPATAATPHQPLATPVVPALAGISPENGLKHSFGKHELWEKWLKVFLDTRRSSHQEIRAALAAGDVAAASTIAHAIKANAGTIGADQLSEAAMALQLALDAGESEQWAPLLANYERELEHVIGGLTTYFSDR
ncbi:MAG TPA: response regulator, partial [Rhodocyclaceae bacterium]|nr:response regulator [Rhodocyclaceae bacterium]